MRKALTKRQQQVLDFIVDYTRDSGYPPTVREMASAFDMSSKGAYGYLKAIEKKGYINTEEKSPRAIKTLEGKFSI